MRNPQFAFGLRASSAALFVSLIGCAPGADLSSPRTEVSKIAQPLSAFHNTGFGPTTTHFPPKTVVLTFDDGPDWGDGTRDDDTCAAVLGEDGMPIWDYKQG